MYVFAFSIVHRPAQGGPEIVGGPEEIIRVPVIFTGQMGDLCGHACGLNKTDFDNVQHLIQSSTLRTLI